MGGLAFASGLSPLRTPRMPRAFYLAFQSHCSEIFRQLYEIVESPIDGPAKTDFGDLDIALQGPKPGLDKARALEQVAEALGAVRTIVAKAGEDASSNLAVPWPDLPDVRLEDEEDNTTPKYVQVDVTIFEDRHRLEWSLFKHAHGDIWNLIGTTIRPYGLTVDNHAAWLRIPDIEKFDKKRAKVWLTADRNEILDFLGLSSETYFQGPFPNLDAMYEYVAQCRMFYVPPQDKEGEQQPDHEGGQGRQSLKSNDRRRMNFRPGFRKWIDEFKPECRRQGRYAVQKTTREEITAEAISRFGVGVEYEARRREFLEEKHRIYIANTVIKGAIPQPEDPPSQSQITYRSCLVKALKKVILENDSHYGVEPPGTEYKDEDGLFDVDKLLDYIRMHSDQVGKAAYDRQMEAYKAKKKAKKAVVNASPDHEKETGTVSTAKIPG